MPRLSLFRPEKGNDYKFFDRNILEMFTVGGTDLHFHKYLGPYDQGDTNKDGAKSPTQPQYSGDSLNERTIQDLWFLENRDRRYADDIVPNNAFKRHSGKNRKKTYVWRCYRVPSHER